MYLCLGTVGVDVFVTRRPVFFLVWFTGDGADREQRAKSKPRLSLGADESAWELQAGCVPWNWPLNEPSGLLKKIAVLLQLS